MNAIIPLVLLLAGGLAVTRAEPEKASSTPPVKTEFSATNTVAPTNASAGSRPASKDQNLQNLGENAIRVESITKAPPSKTRSVLELFNPFAPAAPQPQSRWIERSAWGTTASKVGSSTPVEVRHEAQFSLIAVSR
jgi:hypothetical protein